jgi:hypothetical protein|tara:strand:+ start:662 stop:1003 length:342 start_codon:yes stop_codon:yes gene_type:complete
MNDINDITDTTAKNHLSDFKLTLDEWHTLSGFPLVAVYDKETVSPPRTHVDMLVLAGLVKRLAVINGETGEHVRWVDEWELTDLGRYIVSALGSISDWEKFSYDAESASLAYA